MKSINIMQDLVCIQIEEKEGRRKKKGKKLFLMKKKLDLK